MDEAIIKVLRTIIAWMPMQESYRKGDGNA